MKERFKSVVCADLMITKEIDKEKYILLMRRQNTGSDDGYFELPGGHLEKGEDLFDAMIREAEEELCIKLKRKDLKMIHLLHHYNGERLNFIFETNGEKLKPEIGEPKKCSELRWVKINKLPKETTSKVKLIIKNIIKNKFYDQL